MLREKFGIFMLIINIINLGLTSSIDTNFLYVNIGSCSLSHGGPKCPTT